MEMDQLNKIMDRVSEIVENNTTLGMLDNLAMLALVLLILASVYYLIHIGNRFVPEERQLHLGLEQAKLLFFLALAVWLVVWLFLNASMMLSVLTPFIIAGIIAYAFNPVVKFFTKFRLTRTQAVAGLFLTLMILLVLFTISIFPRLAYEVGELSKQLPVYSRQWYEFVSNWYESQLASYSILPDSFSPITDYFNLEMNAITDWLMGSGQWLVTGVSTVASSIVTLITVPVLAFYFLKDADKITVFARKTVPPDSRPWVFPLARQIDKVLGGFIRGQLLVALFVVFLSGAALLIIGIDYAIILSVFAGFMNIIPYLGPIIGAVPAVFITLFTSPSKTVWVILAFVIIQQLETNLIMPKIVGEQVGLHPALVILALLVGGAVWGLLGLIIVVPIAGIFQVIVKAIIQWFKVRYPSHFDPEL